MPRGKKGEFTVVLVTASSQEEARKIAGGLLDRRLAACVNILGGVRSHFWWQGKVDEAQEHLLIIKTRASLFGELETFVRDNHSYDVPEVLQLPVEQGSGPYLKWLSESVKGGE